jgi:hypothetical protein
MESHCWVGGVAKRWSQAYISIFSMEGRWLGKFPLSSGHLDNFRVLRQGKGNMPSWKGSHSFKIDIYSITSFSRDGNGWNEELQPSPTML